MQQNIFDKVVEGVAANAGRIQLGVGMDPQTEMGPLVSDVQHRRVTGFLEAGLQEGAKAITGGAALNRPGFFVKPTVLVDTKPAMKVVREEIFGPVLVAIPFKEVDDQLLAEANNTIYGLAAGVWTKKLVKSAADRQPSQSGNGMDQLLSRFRRGLAIRRLQTIGMGS